jgi:hydroxypyruvate isomerase
MLRFSANLSILFKEVPFLERFARGSEAGFSAVEFWWPTGEEAGEVARAALEAGVEVVAFNFDAGDMPAGDRGLAGVPGRTEAFRAHVPAALELAQTLGTRRMNALLGLRDERVAAAEQLALARETIAWTADRAAEAGVTVLIEAVNTFENGPYLLATTRAASDFVRSVGRRNVKLQYDVYHMQRMEGNLTATLRAHIGEIAHIQIADAPDRGEPGTGEIRFAHIFREIESLGYDGYIGLEYRPTGSDTLANLGWLPERARREGIAAAELAELLEPTTEGVDG